MNGTILRRFELLGLAPGTIILTFDDGPVGEGRSDALLDLLRARGIRAGFCVIGRAVERAPGVCRRIAAEGHLLVNHGHRHIHPMAMEESRLMTDIRLCDEAIGSALGQSGFATDWYRPPGGVWTRNLERVLVRTGKSMLPLTHFAWDFLPFPTAWNIRRVTETIARDWRRHGGGVYLLHESVSPLSGREEDPSGSDPCAWLLPTVTAIIDQATAEGLRFGDPADCRGG